MQLAIFPDGAAPTDFGWRLSLADVAADGAFSTFPEIDRTLVLVEGPGLWLDTGGQSRRLDPERRSLAFDGEATTMARLLDGPIRDLNVMTRRGRFRHDVRLAEAAPSRIVVAGGTTAVLALEAALDIDAVGGVRAQLGRLDCLLLADKNGEIILSGAAVVVEITASGDGTASR